MSGDYTIHHGDCLEVMAAMDAGSVDAVCTDPPYGLSKHRPQRVMNGLLRALSDIALPNLNETYAELLKQTDLAGISLDGSPLTRRKIASVNAGVGVPERAVDLDGGVAARQVEVEASGESAVVATDVVLTDEGDAEAGEFLGDYVLDLRDAREAAVRYGLGSRFAELGLGRVCVPVVLTFVPGGDQSLLSFLQGEAACWGHSVGFGDDAERQTQGPSPVVAGARTIDRTMLRFDLSGGTLDLLATGGTGEDDRAAIQACPKLVGAGTAAGGLSPELEPRRVSIVFDSANGTRPAYFHLWLHSGEDHRLESIIPRGGFMGKSWDSVTPPADYWRAAYRVLKPSHYLLTFGGCRTHHRVMTSLEDAGFEIVDVLMYLFGSGFPKGRGQLKPAYEPIILARKPGPKRALGIEECRVTANGDDLNGGAYRGRTDGGISQFGMKREIGEYTAPSGRYPANLILECTCDETREGTVQTNSQESVRNGIGILKHGGENARPQHSDTGGATIRRGYGLNGKEPVRIHTDPNCPCAMLDGQTGTRRSAGLYDKKDGTTEGNGGANYSPRYYAGSATYADSGGASRFFYCAKASRSERDDGLYTIRQKDRPGSLSGRIDGTLGQDTAPRSNHHPTVKPLALMRWLVKLVAQPGDVVLDPFAGSGTTGVACAMEGREFIGIEQDADYIEIARRRIDHASAQGRLPMDESPPLAPVAGRPT